MGERSQEQLQLFDLPEDVSGRRWHCFVSRAGDLDKGEWEIHVATFVHSRVVQDVNTLLALTPIELVWETEYRDDYPRTLPYHSWVRFLIEHTHHSLRNFAYGIHPRHHWLDLNDWESPSRRTWHFRKLTVDSGIANVLATHTDVDLLLVLPEGELHSAEEERYLLQQIPAYYSTVKKRRTAAANLRSLEMKGRMSESGSHVMQAVRFLAEHLHRAMMNHPFLKSRRHQSARPHELEWLYEWALGLERRLIRNLDGRQFPYGVQDDAEAVGRLREYQLYYEKRQLGLGIEDEE